MDGVKITVERKNLQKENKYPCFKATNYDVVVLFTAPCSGMVE